VTEPRQLPEVLERWLAVAASSPDGRIAASSARELMVTAYYEGRFDGMLAYVAEKQEVRS